MGCATSKQARRDLRRSPSPLSRSFSVPPSKASGASPPPTLGSLIYGPAAPDTEDRSKDPSSELVEPKAWSATIQKVNPRPGRRNMYANAISFFTHPLPHAPHRRISFSLTHRKFPILV